MKYSSRTLLVERVIIPFSPTSLRCIDTKGTRYIGMEYFIDYKLAKHSYFLHQWLAVFATKSGHLLCLLPATINHMHHSNFRHLSQARITMSTADGYAATIKAPDQLLHRNNHNKASFQSTSILSVRLGGKGRLHK